MGGKILISQEAADPLEIVAHDVGGFAGIEFVAAFIGYPLQRVGKVRIAEQAAFFRGGREIGRLRIVELFQHAAVSRFLQARCVAAPIIGDDFRDRRPITGILNGRFEVHVHRPLTEFAMQCVPAIDCAGHSHRRGAEGRDLLTLHEFVGLGLHVVQRCALGRAAGAIIAVELLGFRVPDNREQIAANAVSGRLDKAQHRICGNGRIHG